MNKMLACLLSIGMYPYTQLFQQELKTYQIQFKQIPLLSSIDRTANRANLDKKNVEFHQKVGFKKKKVEYTLAFKY